MTRLKAEKIIGSEIAVTKTDKGRWSAQATTEAGVVIEEKTNLSDALMDLVESNYRLICLEVFSLQQWRCKNCGRHQPLQGHHKEFRSKGRRDTIENIEGRCRDCHDISHGIRGRIRLGVGG